MDRIGGMELFVRVVEAKGFSAAAGLLGLTPSAVSKQITRLEDQLGARLLHRTTRRLGLTEVGEIYYGHCARILEDIREAEQAVSETLATPRGLLRISVPISFGEARLAPLLPGFLAQYPDIRVSVVANDRYADTVEEGFDVAILVIRPRDSTSIAKRLTANRRVVCASPAYFQKHGMPITPEDLTGHNCLLNMGYSPQRAWYFRTDERQYTVPVRGNLEFNQPQALREAALGGLGVVLLPAYLMREDLQQGLLREALTGYISEDPDVHVLYPQTRHLSPKVRVFVDYLAEAFKGEE